jgi:hypothetical protein
MLGGFVEETRNFSENRLPARVVALTKNQRFLQDLRSGSWHAMRRGRSESLSGRSGSAPQLKLA